MERRKISGTAKGKYPVDLFEFCSRESRSAFGSKNQIKQQIARVYEENRYLLDGDLLSGNEKKAYNEVNLHMGDAEAAAALNNMSMYLGAVLRQKSDYSAG